MRHYDNHNVCNCARAALDTHTSDLVLRVRGLSHGNQVVRLRGAKSTIGSAPQCTLRLVSPGVAPLHCLLLRGPAAAIVRCWSGNTRLNDRSFTDAVLSPGDRLSIGPIELDVLELGAAAPPPQAERESQPARPTDDPRHEQVVARLAELQAERDAIAAEHDDLTGQWNQLAEERRRWQAERAEAQGSVDEQDKRLAAQSAELQSQRNALAAERQAVAAEQRARLPNNAGSCGSSMKRRSAESCNSVDFWPPNRPSSTRSAAPGHGATGVDGRTKCDCRRSPAMACRA